MAAKGAAHLDVLGWGQGGRRRGRFWESVDQAVYPLVNVYITMENHHFFMGNSTINMAIFNSFLYVYQRVVT